MSDKKHWITKLVPVLAFAAGIIIASVGGIMTISSSLKLAFFDSHSYDLSANRQCQHDIIYDKYTISDEGKSLYTQEQKNQCIEREAIEIKNRFQNDKKENIVDGVSALIVGGILLLAFRKRD